MRYQGRVTNWNDERGFGFITLLGGGPTVFVHIKAFKQRGQRPVGNERVTYEIILDKQKRSQAVNVSFIEKKMPVPESPAVRLNATGLATPILFFAAISYGILTGKLHPLVPVAYIILSCIAYMTYAFDKAVAMQRRWRTTESTLLAIGLLGGWPGAMIAQSMFRHKTKKLPFIVAFWFTAAANCFVLGWFVSPYGVRLLSILGGQE